MIGCEKYEANIQLAYPSTLTLKKWFLIFHSLVYEQKFNRTFNYLQAQAINLHSSICHLAKISLISPVITGGSF